MVYIDQLQVGYSHHHKLKTCSVPANLKDESISDAARCQFPSQILRTPDFHSSSKNLGAGGGGFDAERRWTVNLLFSLYSAYLYFVFTFKNM